jgi:hypothetical protein
MLDEGYERQSDMSEGGGERERIGITMICYFLN